MKRFSKEDDSLFNENARMENTKTEKVSTLWIERRLTHINIICFLVSFLLVVMSVKCIYLAYAVSVQILNLEICKTDSYKESLYLPGRQEGSIIKASCTQSLGRNSWRCLKM